MFENSQKIGPYTLLKKVGSESLYETWEAEFQPIPGLVQKVTIEIAIGPEFDVEMIAKARSIAEFTKEHRGLVSLIDVGSYNGLFVLVHEFTDLPSLSNLFESQLVMSTDRAVDILLRLLGRLEFLHNRGIVHGALLPENIFVRNDRVLIGGLGFGRLGNPMTLETVNYFAPEAFNGLRSPQTDIWSVGVLLYLMSTGKLPFPQKEMPDILAAIMTMPFEPLPPSITLPISCVVAKALEKTPQRRYESVRAMRDELQRSLPKHPEANLCARCATPNGNDDLFCVSCGEPLGSSDTQMMPGYRAPADAPTMYIPSGDVERQAPPMAAPGGSVAGGARTLTRKTDSIRNLVKKVKGFFGGGE